MVSSPGRLLYHPTVHDLPPDERPRERLERLGASGLQTAELVAIMLGSGVRGENAIEVSARLLREFGGLGPLMAAELPQLVAQHGLGRARAIQLKAALELGRRAYTLAGHPRPQITGPADVATLLMADLAYARQEQLHVLCLNNKNQVVYQELIYQGTVSHSQVRAAEVFRPAVVRTCPAIIVAHNHPSGDPTPSPEDVEATLLLRKAGELLDIELLDHIVIGEHQFVSLEEQRLGF
jgi:DNA repair protein RadC